MRPFFAQGGTISIREFIVGAFNDEMGLQAVDPLTAAAAAGQRVVTPTGMVGDRTKRRLGSSDDQGAGPQFVQVRNFYADMKRHNLGPETLASRNAFDALLESSKAAILQLLNEWALFPPDDTAQDGDQSEPRCRWRRSSRSL